MARILTIFTVLLVGVGLTAAQRAAVPADESARAVARRIWEPAEKVCDAKWISSGAATSRILLVSIDSSGRHFCNRVVRAAVLPSGDVRVLTEVKAWEVESVANIVQDVDDDGQDELVIPQPVTPYEGAACIAVVPVVHRCDTERCEVVDPESIRAFYRSRLAVQELRLAKVAADSTNDTSSCQIVERDKLIRMTGDDPLAGLGNARQWLTSNDAALRHKAAAVLSDIVAPESSQLLQALVKDSDAVVSAIARDAMSKRRP